MLIHFSLTSDGSNSKLDIEVLEYHEIILQQYSVPTSYIDISEWSLSKGAI